MRAVGGSMAQCILTMRHLQTEYKVEIMDTAGQVNSHPSLASSRAREKKTLKHKHAGRVFHTIITPRIEHERLRARLLHLVQIQL